MGLHLHPFGKHDFFRVEKKSQPSWGRSSDF
jgi:hypothetical protein